MSNSVPDGTFGHFGAVLTCCGAIPVRFALANTVSSDIFPGWRIAVSIGFALRGLLIRRRFYAVTLRRVAVAPDFAPISLG